MPPSAKNLGCVIVAIVKRFVWALLTILAYLAAFDLGGVIVCLFTEVLSIGFAVLFYTIWIVAGAFCGLLGYDSACRRLAQVKQGDWSTTSESDKWGLTALSMTAVMLAILAGLLHKFEWSAGDSQSPYVPDSMPLTLTFFFAVLGSMIVGHALLRPKGN